MIYRQNRNFVVANFFHVLSLLLRSINYLYVPGPGPFQISSSECPASLFRATFFSLDSDQAKLGKAGWVCQQINDFLLKCYPSKHVQYLVIMEMVGGKVLYWIEI